MTETNYLATAPTDETPITDLAQLGEMDLGQPLIPEGVLEKNEQVMTTKVFLPRLQINSSNSKLVTEGKSALGIFCLVYNTQKWVDLGKEVVFVAISLRPKALLMPDNANPISYYDPTTEDFNKVVQKASLPGLNGAMFGTEFLVWIPTLETFATFFHSSETLRRVAPSVVQMMRKDPNDPKSGLRPNVVRGKMKLIAPKNSKFRWWGYEAVPESSPQKPLPDWFRTKLNEELHKFNNPPKSEVEVIDPTKAAAGDARER